MNQMKSESGNWKFWRILYPSLTYLGMNVLVSMAFTMFVTFYIIVSGGGNTGSFDVYEAIDRSYEYLVRYSYEITTATAVVSLPLMILFRHMDRKKDNRFGRCKVYEKVSPGYYTVAAVLGIAACFTFNHLLDISGLTRVYSQTSEDLSAILYQGNLIVEILGVGILIPLTEEFVFRGLTMKRMRDYFGPNAAILGSSFIFAAYHGNMLQGIYAFLLGLLMGYVYQKFQSLWAPILFHISANLTSVIISESTVFNFLYQSRFTYLISTVFFGIVILFALYIIQYRVNPRDLTIPPEDPCDDNGLPSHDKIP